MTSLLPWRDRQVDRFRSEVDRLFEDFFTRDPFRGFLGEGDWMPAVDVSETGKKIVVKAEVPGMDAKDIDISLNGRVLTIKGEKRDEHKEEGENYHRVERRYGTFSRTFELPADVDANKVKATYKDGVLKLELPKTKEQSVKKIEVKSS
ncbi:MAG: Hsp20/alpha crystallin family protein [Deltaproteobacteria bacterium]|nr:Hsp20/alpha crystallin family protein [Deltaproteobacteria bacterium]MBW1924293.1 Hsp20/alpha crystallin family protein [Deltaproteobacteria bacterium]MBW1949900.1 Hsp20/alpha crystallin family protein [Deltaproteobacteria bacterium]MBW2008129.1 Hsp20/alpha crystallin family protein [Deltaproteobacteria bacterium]MBW2102645.1 Hsp20/alpha crystallin family protein [Deltaproteobacteria bacterium]